MTPRPSLPPAEIVQNDSALLIGAELVVAACALAGLGFLLVWALVIVSRHEPPALVVTTLGLLTLVALVAFAATANEVLGTLAATGIGALAGAVTDVFGKRRRDDDVDA